MASRNEYLAKREADRQKFFSAGCDTTAQQMFDMMCLVLHDPDIMGKDTFGADRLKKINRALYEREAYYHEAWCHRQESDYYQEKLDAALREIFGDEIDPFNERYPYMKIWDYNKVAKKNQ